MAGRAVFQIKLCAWGSSDLGLIHALLFAQSAGPVPCLQSPGTGGALLFFQGAMAESSLTPAPLSFHVFFFLRQMSFLSLSLKDKNKNKFILFTDPILVFSTECLLETLRIQNRDALVPP